MRRLTSNSFDDAALSDLFGDLSDHPALAVGVSGGSDSMALLRLLHQWAQPRRIHLLTLTVDHGLRRDSASEAAFVAQTCQTLGIAHRTLRWTRTATAGNISMQARNGRYALMIQVCVAEGILALLTAHTTDDQAETLLMRLARGSGVDGLAAIPRIGQRGDVSLHRPLLHLRRSALRTYLEEIGQRWIDDPTNSDDTYERVRVRKLIAGLELDPDRLAATAARMADARDVLEAAADALEQAACKHDPLGYVEVDPDPLCKAPRDTAHRLLTRLLCRTSGQVYRPRLRGVEEIMAALRDLATEFSARTLHGCVLRWRRGALTILREPAACAPRKRVGNEMVVWDGRFRAEASDDAPDGLVSLGALGERGMEQLAASRAEMATVWHDAPREARLATAALWHGDELIGIPLAETDLTDLARAFVVRPNAQERCVPVDPRWRTVI